MQEITNREAVNRLSWTIGVSFAGLLVAVGALEPVAVSALAVPSALSLADAHRRRQDDDLPEDVSHVRDDGKPESWDVLDRPTNTGEDQ
jgi:hypothetical protein